MPVPRPTMSSMLLPVSTAPIAADGVVLPMPMSPVPRRSTPLWMRLEASSKPVKHRLERLFRGHGRPAGQIAGAAADLADQQAVAVFQAGGVEVRDDPHVGHPHLGARRGARWR